MPHSGYRNWEAVAQPTGRTGSAPVSRSRACGPAARACERCPYRQAPRRRSRPPSAAPWPPQPLRGWGQLVEERRGTRLGVGHGSPPVSMTHARRSAAQPCRGRARARRQGVDTSTSNGPRPKRHEPSRAPPSGTVGSSPRSASPGLGFNVVARRTRVVAGPRSLDGVRLCARRCRCGLRAVIAAEFIRGGLLRGQAAPGRSGRVWCRRGSGGIAPCAERRKAVLRCRCWPVLR